jgi:hypothetical protein
MSRDLSNEEYETRERAGTVLVDAVISHLTSRGYVVEPDEEHPTQFADQDTATALNRATDENATVLVLIRHGFFVTHRSAQ